METLTPNLQPAEYCTEWDGYGTIRTECQYDALNHIVIDVEECEDEVGDAVLVREYVELRDGTEIETFTNPDDGRSVVDGVAKEN